MKGTGSIASTLFLHK